MSKITLIFVAILLGSCAGNEKPPGPQDAVIATYTALNNQDSAAFVESLSLDKRESYMTNPVAVREMLDRWKGRKASLRILSVVKNDSAATVLYDLTITGRDPKEHDSLRAQASWEDGFWKNGY